MRNAAVVARDWHDPRFELPADFASQLAKYDAVIVVGDDPRYDLATISKNAKLVIDGRDHIYPNDPSAPTALVRKQPIATMYTGLVPIVYKAQRTLLRSLINSTFQAFVAISLVMMLVLRSPMAGLVSMFPNVFPVVLIFGYMGLSRILVDIGTMMTASVAMGVAVDDTVHFLTWFRRGLDEGMKRKAAIMLSLRPLRQCNDADHLDRRTGVIRIRIQLVHPDTAVRYLDVGVDVGRADRRPGLPAGHAGWSAGAGV